MANVSITRMKINRDIREDKQSIKKIDKLISISILVAILFIPLLVGAKGITFSSPIISGTGAIQTGYQLDFFSFFKLSGLIAVTIFTLIFFIYKVLFLGYKVKFNLLVNLLLSFIAFIALSSLFAEYKEIALWGVYDRHAGSIAFICYALLMVVLMNIEFSKKMISYIPILLVPFVWINFVMAVLNFYGFNILQSGLSNLFTTFLQDGIKISEGSLLTGTLDQWNYMSGYSAVLTILFLSLTIMSDSKLVTKVIYFITSVLASATLLVSISTSGFLSLVVTLVLLIIILIIYKFKDKKSWLVLISFLMVFSFTLIFLSKENVKVWNESVGIVIEYPFPKLEVGDINLLGVPTEAANNEFELPEIPASGLSLGSGRLYIWGNVMELVAKRPFFGYGLDTLMFHINQTDIEKRSEFITEQTLISKPHNMYLEVLYGTGLFGFLSFLGIILVYIYQVFRKIFARKLSWINVSITLAIFSFLIQGMFNDTVIGSAFVPFILIAIIYKQIQDDKKEGIPG